ncbi:universal stress protein [Fulvivirga sp. 29W222]|uniref:Universal stress protein n=1 Tax=Fulvivirga marina TaxID=2494733 RepID=A0A937G1C1_9BACT|nr:universal stress protein [Fulvivirga marina]MBL6448852.1 universal stress protein [Fulvivirga marina]
MYKILVPTDFSKYAGYATDFALALATIEKAHVHFLHVVEYPSGAMVDAMGMMVPVPADLDFVNVLKENSLKKMEALIRELELEATYDVQIGSPSVVIQEAIQDKSIDLVVMGTRGASGLKEIFIGSNAEKVVRNSLCPVITIHEEAEATEIENIVFASDLREESDELMQKLKHLQKAFHAHLHIVKIDTGGHADEEDELASMEEIVSKYKFRNYTLNVYKNKHEDEGILAFGKSVNADLIALGTHGRTGLPHFLTGSVAENLVNHARCPIWTCHLGKTMDHFN